MFSLCGRIAAAMVTVLPSPEAFPYSFHRQHCQAIHVKSSTTMLGPRRRRRIQNVVRCRGLFPSCRVSCALSLYPSASPSLIVLGYLVTCINDYQYRLHRKSNRQSLAEWNRCSSLDNRHLGPMFLPPIHLFWMSCNVR